LFSWSPIVISRLSVKDVRLFWLMRLSGFQLLHFRTDWNQIQSNSQNYKIKWIQKKDVFLLWKENWLSVTRISQNENHAAALSKQEEGKAKQFQA
jgi:hypothetical protein